MTLPTVTGIVLAAGAGTRWGGPKALARTLGGDAWVALAARTLLAAGCARVVVVLGAEAESARALVPTGRDGAEDETENEAENGRRAENKVAVELGNGAEIEVVVAADWAEGMSASLRAGLSAATGDAALVTLVDLPGLPVEAVRRVLAGTVGDRVGPRSLRQAVYAGRPGHPVLLGSAHWAELSAGLAGDRGARDYLAGHGAVRVECGDVFDGRDVDRPG